ncbi:MAG TPA: hypothetical protein VNS49_25235, partial [Streptomyces sp.]|nr:hypothetical protein [Streptomyces sp.]
MITATVVAVGAPAVASSDPGRSAADEPQPVIPGSQVSDQVTRVIFDTPQTLGELEKKLKGTEVLQLRYTGDVTGVTQPGPGVDARSAIAELKADTVKEYDAPPLVFMAVLDGE